MLRGRTDRSGVDDASATSAVGAASADPGRPTLSELPLARVVARNETSPRWPRPPAGGQGFRGRQGRRQSRCHAQPKGNISSKPGAAQWRRQAVSAPLFRVPQKLQVMNRLALGEDVSKSEQRKFQTFVHTLQWKIGSLTNLGRREAVPVR